MRYDLFIDNQRVDLESANITLRYKSNILNDISRISSHNSYTIKLPKTRRNMQLIECSDVPSNQSTFAYTNHVARLLRNGVEVVSDARVILLHVDKDINISLMWGNATHLNRFFRDNKKLTDLSYGREENVDWFYWGNGKNTPYADYGVYYSFPVISCKKIVERIAKDAHITIDCYVPDNIVVPLISEKAEMTERAKCNVKIAPSSVDSYYNLKLSEFPFENDIISNVKNYIPSGKKPVNCIRNVKGALIRVNITATLLIQGSANGYSAPRLITSSFEQGDGEGYIREEVQGGSATYNGGGRWSVPYTLSEEMTLQDTYIRFRSYDNIVSISSNVGVVILDDRVHFNEKSSYNGTMNRYYFVPNLPDMTQIDFIRAIMQVQGLFAEPTKDGIKLMSFDTLSNKAKAIDWSGKMINRKSQASLINFKLDNFAQKNWFKWGKDEIVTGNYDAYIEVNDMTLELSKTIVDSMFAACDTTHAPYLPAYKEGKINTNLKPRLLELVKNARDGKGKLHAELLVFHSWSELLETSYKMYANIIRQPKMVTEDIVLTAVDLKELDLTIPVYLSQYGMYFAILEVKTTKTDICKVKLLKI